MNVSCRNFLIIISLLLAAGCEVFAPRPDSVAEIDLDNAVYLGVDESVNSAEEGINNLIKITDALDLSSFEAAGFLDNEGALLGKDIIHADAWSIHPAGEQYTIIAGEFIFKETGGENRNFGLLLNNLTGEIFGLGENYFPDQKYGLTCES